ncbi:MAG TPA: hypothetical protein PLK78_04220 [Verrucomicrobiota bacterium]|nr:hypothetical protein [Verrucomicrobiota bacterium]
MAPGVRCRIGHFSRSLQNAILVPVVLSIFLFGEKLNWGKGIGLILALAALLMMWSDKKLEEAQAAGTETASTGTGSRSKWLPLMLLAFVLQGLAAASQKTLVEAGAGDYVWQFYVVLYWTGFAVMTLLSIRREALPTRREFATALAMAMCSVLGNISITSAMNSVKGVVAYPVSNGGSLTLVALAGVLFFREKIHPIGIAGIACGIGAILVLVMT